MKKIFVIVGVFILLGCGATPSQHVKLENNETNSLHLFYDFRYMLPEDCRAQVIRAVANNQSEIKAQRTVAGTDIYFTERMVSDTSGGDTYDKAAASLFVVDMVSLLGGLSYLNADSGISITDGTWGINSNTPKDEAEKIAIAQTIKTVEETLTEMGVAFRCKQACDTGMAVYALKSPEGEETVVELNLALDDETDDLVGAFYGNDVVFSSTANHWEIRYLSNPEFDEDGRTKRFGSGWMATYNMTLASEKTFYRKLSQKLKNWYQGYYVGLEGGYMVHNGDLYFKENIGFHKEGYRPVLIGN